MRRRCLFALPLMAALPRTAARAADDGRMPSPYPASQPRDDSRFTAITLSQMAAREDRVQRKLANYPNLRRVRGQIAFKEANPFFIYLTTSVVKPGWVNADLEERGDSTVLVQSSGWASGAQVLAWVNSLPYDPRVGLTAYTLITNLPD